MVRGQRTRHFLIRQSVVLIPFLLLVGCGKKPAEPAPVVAQNQVEKAPKTNKASNAEFVDFVDNTAKFKGRTITLEMHQQFTLREVVGKNGASPYFFASKPAKLAVVITIPPDLPIPNAQPDEELLVTFTCTEGSLERGNVAKFITRP